MGALKFHRKFPAWLTSTPQARRPGAGPSPRRCPPSPGEDRGGSGAPHKPDPRPPAKFRPTPQQPHCGSRGLHGARGPRPEGRLQAPPPPQPIPAAGAPAARTEGRGSGARLEESTGDSPRPRRGRPHTPCPPPEPSRRATTPPNLGPGAGPAWGAEGSRRAHLGVGSGQAAHVAVAETAVGRAAAAVGAGLGTQRRRSPLGLLHPAGPAPLAALRPLRRPRPAAPRRTGSANRCFPPNRRRRRHALGRPPHRRISARERLAAEATGRGRGLRGRGPMRALHSNQMGGERGAGRGLSNRKAESSEGGGARG